MCLRQRQPPKPKEDTRQSNAEKCRQYKENLKKDSEKWKAYLYKNKVQAQQWRGNQTEEQKEHTRELARKRQQKRREKLAQSEATPKKTSTPKKSPTPNRVTRLTQTKLKEKREKDRIRQAKHRAAVKANPQKFRREKEKRKNKRLEKKAVEEEQKRGKVKVPTTVKLSFKCVLNKAKDVLKKHRSKLALAKLALVKKLLNKSDSVLDCSKTYYKRRTDRYSSTVTTYFNKVAVDVPNKKCGQKQKKCSLRDLWITI
ncbi:hypothetical protein RRG08_024962 [Elysia crispata]|uniref:Uncharacterized protein n=1 Tax=Elysia crispata TaxID=231223 RepID=A0AAE0Z4J7_9GAST|nr:hypothetical protein RRG08_024962 [Elysia crispata]